MDFSKNTNQVISTLIIEEDMNILLLNQFYKISNNINTLKMVNKTLELNN